MELTMQMRRNLIDQALEQLMQERQKQRLRRVMIPAAPAEDCEFPEDEVQEFPEDEEQAFPEE